MLVLTSLLLATSLDGTCSVPFKPSDPPPCAVAKVPGCLPGYKPRFDSSGRILFYACDVDYVPNPAESSPPPPAPPQSQPSPSPELATSPSPQSTNHVCPSRSGVCLEIPARNFALSCLQSSRFSIGNANYHRW